MSFLRSSVSVDWTVHSVAVGFSALAERNYCSEPYYRRLSYCAFARAPAPSSLALLLLLLLLSPLPLAHTCFRVNHPDVALSPSFSHSPPLISPRGVAVDLVGVVCGECAFFFLPSPPRPACLFLVSAFLCCRCCSIVYALGVVRPRTNGGGNTKNAQWVEWMSLLSCDGIDDD